MKKLTAIFSILFLFTLASFTSTAQMAAGTQIKRDTSLYSKPQGFRTTVHTDNDLYYWDKIGYRYRRVNGTKYKVWKGDVTQTSTSAPTVTAIDTLQITNVVFTRDSAGAYKATATGKFTLNKTEVYFAPLTVVGGIPGTVSVLEKTVNFIRFQTRRTDTGALTDAYLSGTTMEIRVNW